MILISKSKTIPSNNRDRMIVRGWLEWIRESGIDDYGFKLVDANQIAYCIWFKYEEDATAFRLKFKI